LCRARRARLLTPKQHTTLITKKSTDDPVAKASVSVS
jgi:hypothetical protein